jgi:hypothetical protein
VLVVDGADADACLEALQRASASGFVAGRIEERAAGEPPVRL